MKIALLTTDSRETWRDYNRPSPGFGTAPEALLQGFANRGDHEIHVISCTQKPVQAPARLAENIHFHSLLVPKIGWLRTGYQGCIRAVRTLVRDLCPDVVHGQGTERDCAISAVFSGFPNVITVHGNMRMIARVNRSRVLSFNWCAARLESFTIPRSDGVVCITNYTKKEVSELARRTWIIPNAVDSEFFAIQARPSGIPQVFCVGTICPRKNQNALILALDSLRQELDFELHIFGEDYPAEPYCMAFFELLKTRPWVCYRGYADRAGLKQALADATMLILPSIEDNCPMVVLEAQAAGVPVAASRVGGIPELISDGKTGLLFDPEDPQEIRRAVETILSSAGQGTLMASAAKEFAHSTFHPSVVASQHLQVYRDLLEGGMNFPCKKICTL